MGVNRKIGEGRGKDGGMEGERIRVRKGIFRSLKF